VTETEESADQASRVPPEVAVLNYWRCANRPSLLDIERAFGPEILSRCIFGVVSPSTHHLAIMEGLHRADSAFDIDELRKVGAAGFTAAGVRGLVDDVFDRQAVQVEREKLGTRKPFVVPRSRAMLDLLAQPDLAVEILAFVPPHGNEQVSRDILFMAYRNFATNIDPSLWRTARKSYAPSACPHYSYDFHVCSDLADPSRRPLLRSLGPVADYQRGVAWLEALEPTLITGIPNLVPVRIHHHAVGETLTALDAFERSTLRENDLHGVVVGREASRERVFVVKSASLQKFYIGMTDKSPADKLRELQQHYNSFTRDGDKYQKVFDVIRGGDAEIAILGREYADLNHEEQEAALEFHSERFVSEGWLPAEPERTKEESLAPRHTTIYKITAIEPEGAARQPACYIGHTSMRFEQRMAIHRDRRTPTIADAIITGPHKVEIVAEGVMSRAAALMTEARFIYRFRDSAINISDPRLEAGAEIDTALRQRIIDIRNEDKEDHKVNLRPITTCRSFRETMAALEQDT
jgi:hypothetical protein